MHCNPSMGRSIFTNFLAGSPLNRLSWLRTSHSFLNAVVVSPATRWILFNGGQPLVASHPGAQKRSLALLTTEDVKPLLGAGPFFGQCEQEEQLDVSDAPILQAARIRGPSIVFLGLKETETSGSALPSSEFKDPHSAVAKLTGTPYFSADIADLDENKVNETIENAQLAKDGSTLTFMEPRAAMSSLDVFTAAIFAEARSMVDWNQRNKFCPACGSPGCTSLLPWADNTDRKPCPSGRGLHNFAHPRTDPVVIMLAIDESGEKVLLGRNVRILMFSRAVSSNTNSIPALAGFVEPGESFEDAVKREMWEEAGVKVWNIRYHSGQPWPYPANLMLGYYVTADSSAPIRTDLDNELEEKRSLPVIRHASGTHFSRRDYKKIAEIQDGPDNNPAPAKSQEEPVEVNPNDEPPFKIPAPTAIAGVLIQHWAEARGKIKLEVDASGTTAQAFSE
ncbi:NUDIX hydrolase domain-like protein [Suillus occidentalis]|nr:NUDIX hydrolase domain-like protein [Suillus occidentalis]